MTGNGTGPSYYDRPAIKEPVWIWSVPAYFYVGGLASGAGIVAVGAQILDREGHHHFIRRLRWVASAAGGVGTGLLVHDLGRPERFLNMLRVFRPTSAMSMGSWTLAASTGLTAGSAVLDLLAGGRAGRVRWLSDLAGLGSGLLATVMGTYTAVLVSDTAVPVWQATRRSLPALFGASALASTADVLDLLDLDPYEEELNRRLGILAKAAELAASTAVERQAGEVERIARPLHEGASGGLWTVSKGAVAASLAVSLLPVPARWRPARRVASAVLGTVGAVAGRFAVFHAGFASARDPQATFAQQRAGRGGAEVAEA